MDYKEAMEYLDSVQKYGISPGLDSIRTLCERLGNPQAGLSFVHVAGTNGKGSVLAFISTVLKEAGYRTGRYISPVIFNYRERIQVNGRPVTKKALCGCLDRIKEAIAQMEADGLPHPTPFEIETAMAFCYFKEMNCDIVVLETGLGGLLDATNIITGTLTAVLTSISMDHMALLGDTLKEIAANKAGIIKPCCTVVSAAQKPEALAILQKRAEELGCPFHSIDEKKITKIRYGVERQRFSYGGYQDLEITLAGQHQIGNAALAIEALLSLGEKGFPVTERQLRRGLARTKWPGRFEVIAKRPYFIVDGAHNEDAAAKLAQSVRFYFTNRRIIYIIGILRDKEYDRILEETCELAEHIIAVTAPDNPRAMPACELAGEALRFHPGVTAADSLEEAVELAYLLADRDSVIIAFGSLSYLGKLIHIVENRDKFRSDVHGKS